MGNTGQLKGLMRAKCHSYYLICDTRCKHIFLQTTLLQLIKVEKVAIAALKTSKLQRWAERYDIKCNSAKLLLWILDTPFNFFWGSCQSISVHQSWSQVFSDDDVCINYVCRGSSHGNNSVVLKALVKFLDIFGLLTVVQKDQGTNLHSLHRWLISSASLSIIAVHTTLKASTHSGGLIKHSNTFQGYSFEFDKDRKQEVHLIAEREVVQVIWL